MALKQKLKEQLIEALKLEDLTPDEIADDVALFGEGLGLDSVDAIEIVVMLDNLYGVKFTNPEESRQALSSINALADHLATCASSRS